MRVTLTALTEAQALDATLSKDRLVQMADDSARCTHPSGGRRFDNFVFEVIDGNVIGVSSWDLKS